MKHCILLIFLFQLLGCTNTKYDETQVPSLISGTYTSKALYPPDECKARANKKEFCGESTIIINNNGSGHSCTYYQLSGIKLWSQLRHVGENYWVGACCKKTITKNVDGSVSYGSNSSYYPSKLQDTKCRNEIPKARYIGSGHYVTSSDLNGPYTEASYAAELSVKGARNFCSSKGKVVKITNIFKKDAVSFTKSAFAKITFKCVDE